MGSMTPDHSPAWFRASKPQSVRFLEPSDASPFDSMVLEDLPRARAPRTCLACERGIPRRALRTGPTVTLAGLITARRFTTYRPGLLAEVASGYRLAAAPTLYGQVLRTELELLGAGLSGLGGRRVRVREAPVAKPAWPRLYADRWAARRVPRPSDLVFYFDDTGASRGGRA